MNGVGLGRRRPKRPTAVTVKPQIIVINVLSNRRSLAHDFFERIFATMKWHRLAVDLISTSEVHVSMAIHSTTAFEDERAGISDGPSESEYERRVIDEDIAGAVKELKQYGTVDILGGLAILSLVGREMKSMKGIAGKMFSVLGENNVYIEMISQGQFPPETCGSKWVVRQADHEWIQEPARSTSLVSSKSVMRSAPSTYCIRIYLPFSTRPGLGDRSWLIIQGNLWRRTGFWSRKSYDL